MLLKLNILTVVLTLIAITIGYICAKEDLKNGEISTQSNIILLSILFITLIASMLINIKIGIIALAMFFLLPISGIGGADVKIITLFFLIISRYNTSYAIFFVVLAFVMPLLLPDRKTIKFLLKPYMIITVIFIIILKLYILIFVIYLLLKIFIGGISKYYTKPISELRVGDYPAQYISKEGDVKLYEEAAPQSIQNIQYLPDSLKIMIGKIVVMLNKNIVKQTLPPCLLSDEDIRSTKEYLHKTSEKNAVLYYHIKTLPYIFLTFLFFIFLISLLLIL